MNGSLSDSWHYREAVYNLAMLRLRIRYSNSVLGFLWTLGNPLFFMIIFSFVFTVLFSNGIENYPVFILAAMLPWNFFNAAVLGATSSVSGAREMLNKLSFPREILPFSYVLAEFINFLMAQLTILVLLTIFGFGTGLPLLTLPLLMAIVTVFSLGVGLLLATINVRLRDTQEFLGVFLYGLFFLTPIVYSLDRVAADHRIFSTLVTVFNPMAGIVTLFRQVIYLHQWPDWSLVGLTSLISILIFLLGFFVFRSRSRYFAEEL
ncbi:MAG: ABC transporter permease [Chloroflexota bacterium]